MIKSVHNFDQKNPRGGIA